MRQDCRILSKMLLAVTLVCIFAFSGLSLAAGESRYEQPVPFEIAHREDGESIGVYKKVGNNKVSASLSDYTLCSIVSTQEANGATWYQVSYFDTSMKEQKGYVKGEEFYQLTVAGLIAVASEADAADYLGRFSGMSGSDAFVSPKVPDAASSSVVTKSSTASASNDEKQITYVLNTNTKKFHYPWCSSVEDIKPKNRKDFLWGKKRNPQGLCTLQEMQSIE